MSIPKSITKEWLIENTCDEFHEQINKEWLQGKNEITIYKFIRRARKLGVLNKDIDFILFQVDFKGWNQVLIAAAQHHGVFSEAKYYKAHSLYMRPLVRIRRWLKSFQQD